MANLEAPVGVEVVPAGPEEQEQAPPSPEIPSGTEPIVASTPAPRRSLKDLRRAAVAPSVFVRGRGTNGRSASTGAEVGGLDQAEALFDIPGTDRGR